MIKRKCAGSAAFRGYWICFPVFHRLESVKKKKTLICQKEKCNKKGFMFGDNTNGVRTHSINKICCKNKNNNKNFVSTV